MLNRIPAQTIPRLLLLRNKNWLCAAVTLLLIMLLAPSAESRENSTQLYKEGADIARRGDVEKAIKLFQRVVQISPYYSLGHYGLGKAYLFRGDRLDDAIKHLRIAVSLDRRLAKGYFYLGLALMFSQKYIHALHAFDEAYRYDSSLLEALYNMGAVYDIMKVDHKASKYFELYMFRKEKARRDILF